MDDLDTCNDLKSKIQYQTNRDPKTMQLTFNNRILMSNTTTISSLGYKEQDAFYLQYRNTAPGIGGAGNLGALGGLGQPQPLPQQNLMNQLGAFGGPNLNNFRNQATKLKNEIMSQPYTLDQILEKDPILGSAICNDDIEELTQ